MIVDAMNLCFRWKHSGSYVFAKDFVDTVKSLARSYDAGHIIIAADWGGSSYRRSIYPEYKQNRKDIAESQSAKEKEEFERFFAEYERALEASDKEFTLLRYKGVEADDIAAYICGQIDFFGFEQIWLISSDRDWDLLINDRVSRFSYVTRKEQTLFTWDDPVPPEDYLSYKCLIGDKGDNIPGIPGIGPVKAKALIEQYGSALDVYDACPIDSKYKYIQNLNENCHQILINYELMDLVTYCAEAIGHENLNDLSRRIAFENTAS
jgi:5'-3' exonuclease